MSYRNNLQKGDRVQHAETKRVGTVDAQPRESSVGVRVFWQGAASAQYVPISDLRLIVNGQPEEVAPYDGELPPDRYTIYGQGKTKLAVPTQDVIDGLRALKAERLVLTREMEGLNDAYRTAKAKAERLDKAIAVLEGSGE